MTTNRDAIIGAINDYDEIDDLDPHALADSICEALRMNAYAQVGTPTAEQRDPDGNHIFTGDNDTDRCISCRVTRAEHRAQREQETPNP